MLCGIQIFSAHLHLCRSIATLDVYPYGLETVPRKYAIVRANRHIIEHVDYLISYVWHPASNARNLLEFAQRREMNGLIQITNLASLHSSIRE